MNNKVKGNGFEREFVDLMNKAGYWVHFITPNRSGSQPCDVIAVKNGGAWLIDCKTSVLDTFPYTRLEYNQIYAFDKWRKCGNYNTYVAVLYQNNVYMVEYEELRDKGRVKLHDGLLFEKQINHK